MNHISATRYGVWIDVTHHLWYELADIVSPKELHAPDDFALDNVDGLDNAVLTVCLEPSYKRK